MKRDQRNMFRDVVEERMGIGNWELGMGMEMEIGMGLDDYDETQGIRASVAAYCSFSLAVWRC